MAVAYASDLFGQFAVVCVVPSSLFQESVCSTLGNCPVGIVCVWGGRGMQRGREKGEEGGGHGREREGGGGREKRERKGKRIFDQQLKHDVHR